MRSDRYSLQHALLASLSITESVTTNYDLLFEEASKHAGYATAVLPYASSEGADRWLLKLHGCVDHPEDIVLTRQDFLRYDDRRGALAAIVQALLITRHMLFVGFSLHDDNFHRIIDDVRKAVSTDRAGPGRDARRFGTVLLLNPHSLEMRLWEGDLDCVPINGDGDVPNISATQSAANRLEIMLDFALFQANRNVSHLLDDRYDGLLTDAEKELRSRVRALVRDVGPELRALPAWQLVLGLLNDLGGSPAH